MPAGEAAKEWKCGDEQKYKAETTSSHWSPSSRQFTTSHEQAPVLAETQLDSLASEKSRPAEIGNHGEAPTPFVQNGDVSVVPAGPGAGHEGASESGLRLRNEGTCIIYSSHVLEEVRLICDRVVVIAGGTVVGQGTPAELCRQTGGASLEDAFVALTEEVSAC